jgi:ArsR family transcriptional regulator
MPELQECFKGLADQTRLRIVNLLLAGELCVCDIQRILKAPQSGISRHLTYLKHAGLVRDRRDGVRIFYRLAGEEDSILKELYEFLRAAFRKDRSLRADRTQLKQALKEGVCAVPPEKARHSRASAN